MSNERLPSGLGGAWGCGFIFRQVVDSDHADEGGRDAPLSEVDIYAAGGVGHPGADIEQVGMTIHARFLVTLF